MRQAARTLVTVTVVGLVTGWVSVGVLARLAMSLLAGLNPQAHGVISDDGFEIGQFTLAGTVELTSQVGTFFGLLSAWLYLLLRPLMIGPAWFRLLSISLGPGVVVGAMIVHTEGVDFTLLEPLWLAAGLFVVVPTLHVVALSLVSERLLERQGVGRWRAPAPVGWPARAVLTVLFGIAVVDLVRDVSALR